MLMPMFSPVSDGLTRSIDFESGSSQKLTISDSNFGSYDRAKWAVSMWIKRESINAAMGLCDQFNTDPAFVISFTSDDKIDVATYTTSGTLDGNIRTTQEYTSTSAWYHILFHYDSANGTAGNRMRLWVDGSEVTVFNIDINPTVAVFDSTDGLSIGHTNGTYYDGLIYQWAFYSSVLPSVGSLYNAGSPVDIRGSSGLYSLLDVAGGDVTSDYILAANWTNVNTTIASTTIPV